MPLLSVLVQHLGLSWEDSKAWFFKPGYFPTLGYNFLGIVVILLANKWLLYILDKRVPYRPKLRRRIVIQLALSLVLTTVIGELHTWIYVYFFNQGISWPLQYTTDFPFTILITLLLNFVYVGFFLQYEAQTPGSMVSSEKRTENLPEGIPNSLLAVKIGSKNFFLDPAEIVLLFSRDKITRVLTQEGKRYVFEKPLKEAIRHLDNYNFFQVNRQTILQRKSIRGYQKLTNRKLEIILHQNDIFPDPIYVSKEKSPQFLNWLSA